MRLIDLTLLCILSSLMSVIVRCKRAFLHGSRPFAEEERPVKEDEFLDVVYWFRQIIAVILGVIWGVAPLKGFLGIIIFCVINAGVLYVYFSSFQQVDEEEYGGTWELTKEGFMTSFALFLVVWIIFYTALHYD
ncbi:Rab5-interacting family protein [Pimephales promelas]|nr:Rab5-interacting family protein [Pimephales promelas]